MGCRDKRSQEEGDLGRRERSAAKKVKIKRVVPLDKVKVRVGVVVGGESFSHLWGESIRFVSFLVRLEAPRK